MKAAIATFIYLQKTPYSGLRPFPLFGQRLVQPTFLNSKLQPAPHLAIYVGFDSKAGSAELAQNPPCTCTPGVVQAETLDATLELCAELDDATFLKKLGDIQAPV